MTNGIQKCPYCGETIISLVVLRYDTSSKPVGKDIKARFCPFCGVPMKEEST